jgi:hypothetical protein
MPTIAPHPVATEPASPAPTGSSLAALFLTSKKALLQGNNICNHASTLTAGSSNLTVDILTLDAKLQWLTRNVIDQLKVSDLLLYCNVSSFNCLGRHQHCQISRIGERPRPLSRQGMFTSCLASPSVT